MSIVASDLSERLDTLTKLVLAEPVTRIGHSRVTVRPLTLRGKAFFQLEYQQGQKVAHRNVARTATSRAARCSRPLSRSSTASSAPSRSAPRVKRASTSARRTAHTNAPPSPVRPAPP